MFFFYIEGTRTPRLPRCHSTYPVVIPTTSFRPSVSSSGHLVVIKIAVKVSRQLSTNPQHNGLPVVRSCGRLVIWSSDRSSGRPGLVIRSSSRPVVQACGQRNKRMNDHGNGCASSDPGLRNIASWRFVSPGRLRVPACVNACDVARNCVRVSVTEPRSHTLVRARDPFRASDRLAGGKVVCSFVTNPNDIP